MNADKRRSDLRSSAFICVPFSFQSALAALAALWLDSCLPANTRVSAISYLNTVPLTRSLLQNCPAGMELSFTLPSQCAVQLASRQADVGLIPSIEYQRIGGLSVLAGPCIASRGRARSILLLSRVPLGGIETVAADTSSRTSVALAELILRCRYGRKLIRCRGAKPAGYIQGTGPQPDLRGCHHRICRLHIRPGRAGILGATVLDTHPGPEHGKCE